MMRLGRQELYYERFFTLDEVIASVEAVTVQDVQDIAQELFDPAGFSSIVLLPR